MHRRCGPSHGGRNPRGAERPPAGSFCENAFPKGTKGRAKRKELAPNPIGCKNFHVTLPTLPPYSDRREYKIQKGEEASPEALPGRKRKPNMAMNDEDIFFQRLCEQHYADLGNFLLALTKDREMAEDLLQETFIIAWQKRAQLPAHPNPAGFLFQTARNCLKSAQRKRAKEQRRLVPLEQQEIQPAQCAADEELLRQQDASIDELRWVDAVLQALSTQERRLYEEHYLRKKSFVQLAKEWGVSQTSLRMRAVRLRRTIQKEVRALSFTEAPPEHSIPKLVRRSER